MFVPTSWNRWPSPFSFHSWNWWVRRVSSGLLVTTGACQFVISAMPSANMPSAWTEIGKIHLIGSVPLATANGTWRKNLGLDSGKTHLSTWLLDLQSAKAPQWSLMSRSFPCRGFGACSRSTKPFPYHGVNIFMDCSFVHPLVCCSRATLVLMSLWRWPKQLQSWIPAVPKQLTKKIGWWFIHSLRICQEVSILWTASCGIRFAVLWRLPIFTTRALSRPWWRIWLQETPHLDPPNLPDLPLCRHFSLAQCSNQRLRWTPTSPALVDLNVELNVMQWEFVRCIDNSISVGLCLATVPPILFGASYAGLRFQSCFKMF